MSAHLAGAAEKQIIMPRILLGWFSAMVAKNVAGLAILAVFALASGGPDRLRELAKGPERLLEGNLLVWKW